MSPEIPYIPDATECRTCGLCIGYCPTFALRREENENPRGRLRLIARLLIGDEPLTEHECQALHNCLQCRACERVCPSRTPYGQLIALALTKLATPTWPTRLLTHRRTMRRGTLNAMARITGLYQGTRFRRWIATALPLPAWLKRADALLPDDIRPAHMKTRYPAVGVCRGRVALFLGCVGSIFDQETRQSAVRLLTLLGYEVHVPPQQQCCGALHAHNGARETAERLAQANLAAFAGGDYDAILYCDSGCGATLHEYAGIDSLVPAEAERFTHRLTDVTSFLANCTWPDKLRVAPLAETIAVHEPCSQRFPLGSQDAVYRLLSRLPGATLVPLAGNERCCGAGGLHMLTHPEIADPLREQKLDAIRASGARVVVTSNIGCLLHIGAGLRETHAPVTLIHPVTLLARMTSLDTCLGDAI